MRDTTGGSEGADRAARQRRGGAGDMLVDEALLSLAEELRPDRDR